MAKFKITKQDVIDVIKKRWWIMLIELGVLGVILLFDLLTKKYAVEFLSTQSGWSYPLMEGFIHLTYTENTGAGFGMFSDNTTALTVITAIVIAGILIYLIIAQKETMWLRIPLIFIAGGGIGNLVDRIALGYVRDFIKFAFWDEFAIFNIADAFVTVGVFMLIIVLIVMLVQEGKKNRKAFEEEQANKPAETLSDPLDNPIPLNPMMSSPNDYTFEESTESAANTVGESNSGNAEAGSPSDARQDADDSDDPNIINNANAVDSVSDSIIDSVSDSIIDSDSDSIENSTNIPDNNAGNSAVSYTIAESGKTSASETDGE